MDVVSFKILLIIFKLQVTEFVENKATMLSYFEWPITLCLLNHCLKGMKIFAPQMQYFPFRAIPSNPWQSVFDWKLLTTNTILCDIHYEKTFVHEKPMGDCQVFSTNIKIAWKRRVYQMEFKKWTLATTMNYRSAKNFTHRNCLEPSTFSPNFKSLAVQTATKVFWQQKSWNALPNQLLQ